MQASNFSGNSATNGGGIAVHSAGNATFNAITAVGNTATFGGAMFVDRTALLQVTVHMLAVHFMALLSCLLMRLAFLCPNAALWLCQCQHSMPLLIRLETLE